jgi:hypothetical protein
MTEFNGAVDASSIEIHSAINNYRTLFNTLDHKYKNILEQSKTDMVEVISWFGLVKKQISQYDNIKSSDACQFMSFKVVLMDYVYKDNFTNEERELRNVNRGMVKDIEELYKARILDGILLLNPTQAAFVNRWKTV